MRLLLSPLVFLVCLSGTSAQDPVRIAGMKEGTITVDNARNIFVYNEFVLVKRKADDGSTMTYSKKMRGEIASVDVTNPQKILVFHKAQGICVFLDSYLKELQTPIDFANMDLPEVALACSGSDNSLWCFDYSSRSLLKIDDRLHVVARSPDVSKLATTDEAPGLLVQRGDRVFLSFPAFGVLVFGTSGEYLRTIHLPPHTCFLPVSDDTFFYADSSATATLYNFTNGMTRQVPGRLSGRGSCSYQGDVLYEFSSGMVYLR